MSDLLSVEVVQRQPQHVQSRLGRHILVLGNDLDEHDLENLNERQVIKSTLMINALKRNSDKEPRRYQKVEEYGEQHPRAATADHVNVSKRGLKRPSSSSILFERS